MLKITNPVPKPYGLKPLNKEKLSKCVPSEARTRYIFEDLQASFVEGFGALYRGLKKRVGFYQGG